MFLTKEQLELLKKEGWQPMTTKDGTAWFGGKSHKELAKYVPSKESENLQDMDFLVIAYAKQQ